MNCPFCDKKMINISDLTDLNFCDNHGDVYVLLDFCSLSEWTTFFYKEFELSCRKTKCPSKNYTILFQHTEYKPLTDIDFYENMTQKELLDILGARGPYRILIDIDKKLPISPDTAKKYIDKLMKLVVFS